MSLEEFQQYWRGFDGPLVARQATTLDILRYVQVPTLDDPVNDQLASARGGRMEKPYDGVAELWWVNREVLNSTLENEAARVAAKELLDDERNFIDLESSPLWLAYEYPQLNPTLEEPVAREHSSLV